MRALIRRRRFILLPLLAALVLALPAARTPAQTARPNVLVIVTDDERWDQQPLLARTNKWLGGGGTAFVNAFATTPLCCPSRSSILTGKYTHNHGVTANDRATVAKLDMNHTLQRALRDAGYQTGMAGKFFNGWRLADNPPHFDRWALMRAGYVNTPFNVNGTLQTIPQYSTDFIGAQAEAMIDGFQQDPSRPWFMYVAPSAAHWPYTPATVDRTTNVGELRVTPSMNEADRSDKPSWIENYGPPQVRYSTADASRWQRRSLLAVDRMVDRLMQKVPANTLVIFLSDNGYMLGEHGVREDKRLPYMESVRIPLLMRWPGRVVTQQIDTRFAANVDVAPTIAAATGVTAALPAMDGRNLLGDYRRNHLLLESYQTIENANDLGFPGWRSLLTPQGQYTEWLSPDSVVTFREYYEASDRYQMTNLVATEPLRAAGLIKPLKPLLSAYSTCRGAACP